MPAEDRILSHGALHENRAIRNQSNQTQINFDVENGKEGSSTTQTYAAIDIRHRRMVVCGRRHDENARRVGKKLLTIVEMY